MRNNSPVPPNPNPNHEPQNRPLPCVLCQKRLSCAVGGDAMGAPHDAVVCMTGGNYGSKLFDPMGDGHFLVFSICDECLKKASKQGLIALGFATPYEQRPLCLWLPDFEDPPRN